MYCSKCKYTTFDHFDNCPKCGRNWQEEKDKLGLAWLNFSPTSFASITDTTIETESINPEFSFEESKEITSPHLTAPPTNSLSSKPEEIEGDLEISFEPEPKVEPVIEPVVDLSSEESSEEPLLEVNLENSEKEEKELEVEFSSQDFPEIEEPSPTEELSLDTTQKEEEFEPELDDILKDLDLEEELDFTSPEKDEEEIGEDLEEEIDLDLDLDLENDIEKLDLEKK